RLEGALDIILGQFRQRHIEGSDEVLLELGCEKPDSAEDLRCRRHQYRADFEGTGGLGSKKRTVAAEGNESEVSRIPTALDCNRAYGPRDAGAADEIGAVGSFLQWQIQGRGNLHRNRAPRFGCIEPQPARQSVLREIAQRHVGVGQGRRGSAIVVTDWAWHSA